MTFFCVQTHTFVFYCLASDDLSGETDHTNLGAADENKETHSTNETATTAPEGQQVGTDVFIQ